MPFLRRALSGVCLLVGVIASAPAQSTPPHDIVISNATVMTVTHGTLEHASVWVHDGKIAGFGATVNAPADAVKVDALGEVPDAGDHRSSLALRARQRCE